MLDLDLHVHTCHSPCGWDEMLPETVLRLAAERGIRRMAITDHYYPDTDPADLEAVRAAVARTAGAPEVYFGCEAEVMAPGVTAGSPELAEKLDFVMVGATHFQNKGMTDLPPGDDEFHADYYLKMFEYGVSLPWANVMAHPFYVVKEVCSPGILKHLSDARLLPAIELARENNVAMEISRRILATPEQTEFSTRFLRLCKRVGTEFTLGSDAHCLEDLGKVSLVAPIVSELGLAPSDFYVPSRC
ncbi:MAG: PHP domain-containing protein [Armatimonadota bacterium]